MAERDRRGNLFRRGGLGRGRDDDVRFCGNQTAPGGPPPPQYVYPDNTGNKFTPQEGYYGQQQQNQGNNYPTDNYASGPYGNQQQSGIELQQPAGTYQRATVDDYAPPEGPPPPKRN